MENYKEKITDLIKAGEEELAFQLMLSQGPDNGGTHNVFGTICWIIDDDMKSEPQIEVFKMIKSYEDYNDLNIRSISLRHRFNSQRHYKCFGIKVTEEVYEDLLKQLNKYPINFAKWIESLNLNYFIV